MLSLKNSMTGPLMIGAMLLGLNGCRDKSIQEITYTANVPIYMSEEVLETSVKSSAPQELASPGKIHVKGSYIYVVDLFKGIHIISNANPAAPENVGYINVPGVVDIASKGNMLYVDSYTDLLTIDISNLQEVTVASRVKDVFQQILPPTNNYYPLAPIDPGKGVVIGWKEETITETTEIDQWGQPNRGNDITVFANDNAGGAEVLNMPNQNGISGSMARFTVSGDALYALDVWQIKVFDISTANNPAEGSSVAVNRTVETLFPMNDRLFVGTTSGMVVYDISSSLNPAYLSEFNHATACDPVVVQGDYAYITLRTGNNCAGWRNQLDVIDISDITSPQWVATHSMTNPHGLGIDNGTLFICDGSDGLKVFNASDPVTIDQHLLGHFPGIQSYDVIPLGETLLMIGSDGLYQYDYSNTEDITLLSVIPVY